MNSTIQKSVTNIVLIAGEPSGDLLGAKLIAELKILFPFAKFTGVGGKNMISQGLQPIFPMEDLTVMGFVEVLPYLPKLISRINKTAQYLKQVQPQIVITIDSPDFCFRVIPNAATTTTSSNCVGLFLSTMLISERLFTITSWFSYPTKVKTRTPFSTSNTLI